MLSGLVKLFFQKLLQACKHLRKLLKILDFFTYSKAALRFIILPKKLIQLPAQQFIITGFFPEKEERFPCI